jgi:predicted ATPase
MMFLGQTPREVSHPFSLAYALFFGAVRSQFVGNAAAALEQAEAAISIASDQGFPIWVAGGRIVRGWALANQGQIEGIDQMENGLASWAALGAEQAQPYFLALLAEALGKIGQVEKGLALLENMSKLINRTGERFYEAELYRLKGELLRKSGIQNTRSTNQREAEECFNRAIVLSRSQAAKSMELRSALSLSRQWLSHGKKNEAKRLLSETLQWFVERGETIELKPAEELLEEAST